MNAAQVYPSFLLQNREVRQVVAGAHERQFWALSANQKTIDEECVTTLRLIGVGPLDVNVWQGLMERCLCEVFWEGDREKRSLYDGDSTHISAWSNDAPTTLVWHDKIQTKVRYWIVLIVFLSEEIMHFWQDCLLSYEVTVQKIIKALLFLKLNEYFN